MQWYKKGLIYKPDGQFHWNQTHAQVPFPFKKNNDEIRIYFATRDRDSCSCVSFIEVLSENPSEILYIHNHPCLSKGALGSFDDAGTMPSWFITHEDKIYMYYTGWNKNADISYRLSIGLAASNDGGRTFQKLFQGPILDRSKYDPVWVAQPSVLKKDDTWKMWYLSCQKIKVILNHPEPFYIVKYAESDNGIDWTVSSDICIDFDEFTDAIGRPFVYYENGLYKMYYSYRNATGYRVDSKYSYRLGYAESNNGVDWIRKDQLIKLIARNTEEWDLDMQAYPSFYKNDNKKYLFYNGNGFGLSGLGYAEDI